MAHHTSLLSGGIAAFLLAACAPPEAPPAEPSSPASDWSDSSKLTLGRPHLYLTHENASPLHPAPPPAGNAQLTYNGGPVISNVKAYAVFWGNSVAAQTKSTMPDWLTQVTNSSYLDWLNEYNTVGQPQGTNQLIGRGAYAGAFTISPSATGSTVSDQQIASELTSQVSAGHLPTPDGNSLYITFFPPGVTITQGGSQSCVGGGFCAYHSSVSSGGGNLIYAVIPDDGVGSGCDTGCGNQAPFDNLCVSTSHEMVEAITDCDIGNQNIAWYDQSNGEIGDICAQGPGASLPGTSYYVQNEWSNTANACIESRTAGSDFSVSFTSPNATIPAGGSTQLTVHTQATAGSPGNVALSVALPTGVTGSVSPQSVQAGGTATLTLNTSSSTLKNVMVVVTGTAGSASHTAAALLTTGGTPPPPQDFSINVSPAQASLPTSGGNTTVTVGTAVAGGSQPGNVSLSVSGLPSGVTPTFQSSTITSGQTSVLALTAASGAPSGTYTVTIAGQSATNAHQTSLSLTISSLPPLSVAFSSPAQGATLSGSVTVSVTATNASANATLAVTVDNTTLGGVNGSSFTGTWDTTRASNGSHTLSATVSDNGLTASSQIQVTVNNGTSSTMTAQITSPSGGQTLSGSVNISARATPSQGATISGIEIYVDTILIPPGRVSGSPATVTLDTSRLSNGAHALKAIAYDSAGNMVTSPVVNVTFQNTAGNGGGTPPPTQQPTPTQPQGCHCGASGFGPTLGLIALALLLGRRRRAFGV